MTLSWIQCIGTLIEVYWFHEKTLSMCISHGLSLSPVRQPFPNIQQVLEMGDLTQTAALMTPPCPVHKHERPLLPIG